MNDTVPAGRNAALAATPPRHGVLKLLPIYADGAPRDFTCVSASARAASLLGSAIGDVAGRTLIEIMGPGHQTMQLVHACAQALQTQCEWLCVIDVATEAHVGHVLHKITPVRHGLMTTLTCPTAGAWS